MKILRLFFKVFWILVNSKLDFFKPQKKIILIFDHVNSDILKDYLPEKDTGILFTRKERINLSVLFLNFIKGKFTPLEYFEAYIDAVKPKVVITCIDNNPLFYRIKKNKLRKKIVIATTWRTPVHDSSVFQFQTTSTRVVKDPEFNADHIFVLNESIGKFFKELNIEIVSVIGSFKSNHYKIDKKKDIKILYISSWNDLSFEKKITSDVNYELYDSFQKKLLKNIYEYCKKYNFSISILGKKSGKIAEQEYKYFENIFKNINWKFIKSKDVNSYETIDRSELIITQNSTLGYESLSRGNKTIFFNESSKLKSLDSLRFGWPDENLEKAGPFWTDQGSFSSCENILNKILNLDFLMWKEISERYIRRVILRDENNIKFKSILKKYIS
jgi:surface carbohydrate biosynthesis protein